MFVVNADIQLKKIENFCIFVSMNVFVLSKQSFDELMKKKNITSENVESYKQNFFISINDTCGTDEVPYFENKSNVKVLFFDDVDVDITTGEKTAKAFTKEQAIELLNFVEQHKDKGNCIVHCAAGISRSGAVGTFINDYFGGDHFVFKKTNPYVNPNGHVLRTLKMVVNERTDKV